MNPRFKLLISLGGVIWLRCPGSVDRSERKSYPRESSLREAIYPVQGPCMAALAAPGFHRAAHRFRPLMSNVTLNPFLVNPLAPRIHAFHSAKSYLRRSVWAARAAAVGALAVYFHQLHASRRVSNNFFTCLHCVLSRQFLCLVSLRALPCPTRQQAACLDSSLKCNT